MMLFILLQLFSVGLCNVVLSLDELDALDLEVGCPSNDGDDDM